jgi:hypothetical protein
MTDPLSTGTGVVALVTFAFQTAVGLHTAIRSYHGRDKLIRELKNELQDLTAVLQSLLETVVNHPGINFDALKLPLLRCGKTCKEYRDFIAKCTKHSSPDRQSFRDWVTQQFLKGDITDFRAMLAVYKATINVALATANL